MTRNFFSETLEARTLMSASTDTVLDTAVKSDQTQIQTDLAQFRADCFQSSTVILADILAIRQAAGSSVKALVPAVAQFRSDLSAMNTLLAQERQTEAASVTTDESAIAAARLKAKADKGTPAESTDLANILADRIQLQTDMVAGLNARIQTRQRFYTAIFNDGQAVIDAVSTNTNPTVVADVKTYINDKTTWMKTLTGDLRTLYLDRMQLVTDLMGLQSSA